MDLINNIKHLRAQALQKIQDDAKKGQTESLQKFTTIVTELEKLLNQINQISNSYLKIKEMFLSDIIPALLTPQDMTIPPVDTEHCIPTLQENTIPPAGTRHCIRIL